MHPRRTVQGVPVESLRSTHARVAALIRHRGPDDPEVAAAREQLAVCKAKAAADRKRVRAVPIDVWAQVLTAVERTPTGV